MNSMTGFGRGRTAGMGWTVESHLSSINKRGQEISINLPTPLAEREADLSSLIAEHFERGKLQLTVKLSHSTPSSADAEKTVITHLAKLKALSKKLKIEYEPDTELLWEILSSPTTSSKSSPPPWPLVQKAVRQAILACQRTQQVEGKKLQKDFAARLKNLASLRLVAQKLAQDSLPLQRERLLKNLQSAGLTLDTQDERLLKELAFFADRVDVSEELTRIDAHLSAAHKLIASSGSIGRQIEFLLQELQREWNTLGNKSPQVALVQTALSAKNEIERMREQAANIM